MELISVVVPVFNAGKFLIKCVNSIRQQTYNNLEIILVDDGSSDNSPQICDELKRQDNRIKVIHKQNAGQGFARNDGLEISTGKYVTFVDSDDWISVDHIENLYNAIINNSADCSLGNHIKVCAGETKIIKYLSLSEKVYEGEEIVNELLIPLVGADLNNTKDVLINSSVSMNMYSMDIINKNNIRFISERYAVAEDFYFNIDFFHYASRIVYTKEDGYYYFQNSESTSEKYNPKRFERTLNYYRLISEKVNNYGLNNRVEHRIERSFLMKIRVAIRHVVLSDLKRKNKFLQIKEILTNDIVQSVLNNYPIKSYSFGLRILTCKMRAKNVCAVYFLMLIREKARGVGILKHFLKYIGIGR